MTEDVPAHALEHTPLVGDDVAARWLAGELARIPTGAWDETVAMMVRRDGPEVAGTVASWLARARGAAA